MDIIGRGAARSSGLKFYFTGKPCKHGHVAKRRVHGGCIGCEGEKSNDWKRKNPEWLRAYSKARYAADPIKGRERVRKYARKRLGSSPPTRETPQLCECCSRKPNGKGGLHLDHCHVTGLFRGWLCHNCNTALGLLGDSQEGLLRALEYLRRVHPLRIVA